MAILLMGEVVTGIRGSVGGVVYSANGASAYAKCKGWPRQGISTGRAARRAMLGSLGEYWGGLSDGDRADWGAWAAAPGEVVRNSLGEVIALNGWQWFGKIVLRRFVLGSAPDLSVPTGSVTEDVVTMGLDANLGSDIGITHSGDLHYFDGYDLAWFAGVRPGGVAGVRCPSVVYGGLESTLGGEPYDVHDRVLELFPELAVDEVLYVRCCRQTSEGLRGPMMWCSDVVAA